MNVCYLQPSPQISEPWTLDSRHRRLQTAELMILEFLTLYLWSVFCFPMSPPALNSRVNPTKEEALGLSFKDMAYSSTFTYTAPHTDKCHFTVDKILIPF